MTQPSLSTRNSGLRVFSAALLSALLIVMPFVQLAAAEGQRSRGRGQSSESGRQGSDSASKSNAAKFAAAPENLFLNAPVPKPAPEPLVVTAAQLKVTLDDGVALAASKRPGETITYTATIQNTNPTDDATNVIFTNDLTANPNLTLVGGSVQTQPIAKNDTFTVLGNVRITVADGAAANGGSSGDLLNNDFDPDTAGNTGLTITTLAGDASAPFAGTSVRGGNVTATTGNGAFEYNPPAGYDGTDSFTYTVTDADGKTDTATVNITITGMVWFINNASAVCTSRAAGCGRLTDPFSDLQSFAAAQGGPGVNNGDAVDPEAGDNIFLYTGNSPGTPYTAPLILLNTQKLIGQGATDTLVTISGVTLPPFSDTLPTTNEPTGTNPTPPTITSAAGGILLANGNTLRGFNIGAVGTAQAKIQGTNFGTLTAGKTTEPDVSLSGAGRILSLTTGTFAATSGFNTVASTSSSGGAAILLSAITAGTVTFVSTSISGGSGNGIDVSGSSADINFGNSTITGGTNGVALANNPAGTRSFGTLSISSGSGIGFQHSDPDGAGANVGGGAVSVTGATTVTDPAGNGIDIQNSNANLSFASTTVSKGSTGNTGVNLVNNATRTIAFTSLTVTTTNAFALLTNNSGTVTAGGGSLTQSGAGGGAGSFNGTSLGLTFTSVSSNGGVNGLLFITGTGTFTSGTTNLQNNTAVGLSMSNSTVAANFGNTTVNSSAADAVDISTQGGNVTFADLDLTPDANQRGLDVSNSTGTLTSTSGDIAATGAPAISINGPAGRTPLAMVLNNVDSTNSTIQGVFLNLVSGNLTVNDAGTATNIQNSAHNGIELTNGGAGTINFGNTTVNSSGNANGDDTGSGILLTNNAGAVTFGALTVTPDSGERGFYATDSDGTAAGAITIGSGTITTTNDTAVEITGQATGNRTPLNVQLTTVNTTGGAVAPNGIRVVNTSATGSPGGFRVLGTGGTCTNANTTGCTGGRITNTTGADGATGGNGIQLENVDNARFTRMRIDDNSNNGIKGINVNIFVLDTSVVQSNGTAAGSPNRESGLHFDGLIGQGLVGTSSITNSDIRNNFDRNALFDNGSGTLHLTITGTTFQADNNTDVVNDNVLMEVESSATVFMSITGSTFGECGGDHIDMSLINNAVLHATVTGNTMTGDNVNRLGQGITMLGATWNGTARYNVSSNNITGTNGGGAIHMNKGSGTGDMQGTISSNTIGNAGIVGSGARTSTGIRAESRGTGGGHTTLISNNQIRQYRDQGILVEVGEDGGASVTSTAAFMKATVSSNTLDNTGNTTPAKLHGLHLNSGVLVEDNNTTCFDASNNILANAGSEADGGSDFRARQRQATRVEMPGYVGTAFNTASEVQAYFVTKGNTHNSIAVSSNNDPGTASDGWHNTAGGVQCTQPAAPTLPTAVAFFEVPNNNQQQYFASIVNSETSATVIAAAITREVGSAVSQVSFLTPIANTFTSSASETGVRIAPSVEHSAEVSSQRSDVSEQKSEVRAHHALNSKLETRNASETQAEMRSHQATVANLATANASVVAAAPVAGSFTVNIGTLPANDSVTITFQVTIANTLTPAVATTVSNQATVTADGGINKVSDDPETTPPAAGDGNDATVTNIDKFEPVIDIQSSDTTTDQGESVTFTATLTHGTALVDPLPTGTVDFVDQGTAEVLCNDVALTVGALSSTAPCATTAVDAGTRTIAAIYSGDGRYDTATDTVVQTVTACGVNPVVTKIADTNDGTCDADCSLREALATVCSAAGNNTITFASGVGQAFENPATITLSASFGNLTIDRNMTIQGPAHGVTVVGSGNASHRVFVVNAGRTATIDRLTITGGNSDAIGGGGIKNDGTLTLKNSTVSGNATTQNGAGIHNSNVLNIVNSTISGNASVIDGGGLVQDNVGATLYMVNSTVSGNTANGYGGGLDLRNGTVTILNSTITGNHGDNDDDTNGGAGGIRQQSATVTIRNTIVAGNYKGSGTTTANDIEGTVSGNSNLIGDAATAGGLTNGVNGNIVGAVIATVLDTVLSNNGGPTQTHRLITGSAALDAGDDLSLPTDTFDADGDANTGETLGVDQRGQPRVVDNPNVVNAPSGLDIGAYEAPAPPSTPDLDAASDTGASNTDNYTSDSTPTFAISGVNAGETVHLLRNGTSVANAVAAGSTIQLTDPAAPDGTHTYSARRIVAGGTSPDSGDLSVTIDTGAPGTPTIDLQAASDSGSSDSDNITNAATRTFDIGNTENGATVELRRDGNLITSTTGTGGTVVLSDSTAAVSGTTYAYTARQFDNGGLDATSSAVNVLFDTTAPAVSSIVRANGNPTSAASVDFTVTFSENVTGVDTADFTLTPTGGISGASVTSVTPINAMQYTVTVNTGTGDGTIRLDLTDDDSIADVAGNIFGGAGAQNFTTGEAYTVDKSAPTANITDVSPDPRNTAVSSITIVFSEAVTGFDINDLTLTLNGGANLLTGAQTLNSGDGGVTWTLGNLSGITGAEGTYLLTLTAAGSGITDAGSNALAGDATDSWVVDTTAPTVTINQAAGQADPTSASPINFTVVFSEPVTGFTNADVTFSGAGATTANVTEIAPNDGTTYNVAISGMNADGTVQASVNVNAAQDGVGNNSAASTSTDNQVQFINAITITIHDAKVAEPKVIPNTIDMTFTVTLSAPAPGPMALTVNFTTNNGSATGGICNTPGVDFTPTNGQVAFATGQQFATINVPVCSDNVSEGDETFTVTLSAPTSPGVFGDDTATGTITATSPAGAVLISELRTSGPAGAGDDFVEIYNNSDAPLTVAASDISAGYGLYKMGANCNAAPILIGVIPNGTVIPARGHYLFTGSAYSLGNYGGAGAAAGNLTMSSDLETDANVGLFSTSEVLNISSVNRLDAVGFSANVGGTCNLLREATTLPGILGNATTEHSYFRKMCEWVQGSGCTVPGVPKDTNVNADDFWLADTQALTGRLGAPGPENIASPLRRDNAGVNVFLLDGNVAPAANPNRSRDNTMGVTPVSFGTMTLRYRVTNNTGAPVTRLRYRIVDISTANQPGPPNNTADLRALTSTVESGVGPVNDPVTCALVPAGTPCNVTVQATTLEQPPNQTVGGGYNSTLSSGTITTGTPLGTGNSILINFRLGVEKTGTFRFYIIVEALP